MDDQVLDAPQGASDESSASVTQNEPVSLRDTIASAVAKQRDAEPKEAAPELKAEPKADADRNRDEQGRFAKGPEAKAEKPEEKAEASPGQESPKADAPAPTALRPPTSWSPTAKVAFDKLPVEVQQAVAKREEEVNNGFAKFQEYKPIEPYLKMAKDSGTTLDQALSRYVAAEQSLRKDFVGGTVQLARQQNINPVELAFEILARHGVAPDQTRAAGQQQPHQQVPAVDLTPINKRLDAFEAQFNTQQQAAVDTEIERFASDPKHPFFENVKIDMGRLLDTGQAVNLDDAYDKACWANKEIRDLLIKQQSATAPKAQKADDAVQRAKAAAKATGGAPAAGFTPSQQLVAPGASIRDTVLAAVNAQRGL